MGNSVTSAPAESFDGNQTFMSFQQSMQIPGEEYKMAIDPVAHSSRADDSSVHIQDGYIEPMTFITTSPATDGVKLVPLNQSMRMSNLDLENLEDDT